MNLKIEDLREFDIGKNVTYTAGHGAKEYGIISSWNDKCIFVRYIYVNGDGIMFVKTTAQATSPEDLTWT